MPGALEKVLHLAAYAGVVAFFTLGPTLLKEPYFWAMSKFETEADGFIALGVWGLLLAIISYHSHFAIIYALNLPYFEQYKINDKPWPWQEDPVKFRKTCIFSLKLFLFNVVVAMIIPPYLIAYNNGLNYDFGVESFPSIGKLTAQVLFCVVLEDFLLYWLHRMIHHPLFYDRVHKLHHNFYCPVSFSAYISHPFEYFFVNTLPFLAGPLVLGKSCHFFTFLMWSAFKISEGANSHCGYDFPWMPLGKIPFSGGSDWHDYHHSHNKGIYGDFFFIWDKLMGTDVDYQKHKQAKLAKLKAKQA
jgi:sterol desaturase/sphingolipid hydroxylase (fatty acid hydroxylase superfamily)